MNLGLTYDTTPERMQLAMNIMFIYYIKKGRDIAGTQTEINMEILKQFNDNGLEFAFPTQTLYNINQG